jgi:hypothetical protein
MIKMMEEKTHEALDWAHGIQIKQGVVQKVKNKG